MPRTRLQAVDVEEIEGGSVPDSPSIAAPIGPSRTESAFTSLLAISLKSLSQRTVVALSSLVDLAMLASAFVLWLKIIAEPSVLQLVGLGMYAAFILIALWARRGHAR
jgi:uncharacterized membrane protein